MVKKKEMRFYKWHCWNQVLLLWMKLIQVLGTGCAKCTKLKENAEQAVAELGVEATVEKIEDINVITGFGVMMTL